MAYGDSAARIRAAKEKLMMRNSPGASEDARIIARKQGAKTSKKVETNAKLIAKNRINDAQKSLTRAKMQGANAKLMRSVNPPTFKPPKATAKPTPKAKPKTLNDFLKEGKRPPSKNKKIPSDADVIIKGYNDKKTLSKNKKKK
jgi:hypothetical protein